MSNNLFENSDGSGDDDGDLQLNTNKDYAKSYNHLRKRELLQKYKDRGYDVNEDDDSSDSSSSDEDEAIDPKFDQEFFKTLASLKSKHPSIYDKNTKFFAESPSSVIENSETKKEKKPKPVSLQEYERKILLEKKGVFDEDSDVEHVDADDGPVRSASPTAVETERRLKAEFKKVLNASDDDSDDEDQEGKQSKFGGIFSRRQKTNVEEAKEEEDFVQWLAGKRADIQKEHKEKLQPLKTYWSNQSLPQSERFLRDYILSKGYANAKSSEIPTYEEIVGDEEPAALSEDENELERQADFEQKYNFRFEEPDAEFVKRYPRTIENSVRRSDDKRKTHRQEVRERKAQEKAQIMKEFEMVKEMKRKEIEEKIKKLKLVTGNEELGFRDDELEEDFDPVAHDKRMEELFNDEYYQVDEGDEKPECPSDIEELQLENWDNYNPRNDVDCDNWSENDGGQHCEDEDFNMDCDYDPMSKKLKHQQELIENSQKPRGRKGRRNRFKESIQAEKPAFDPEDAKTYEEYLDEYYQLDCEDVIGDLPCRFKYVETTPNDFGLSIEEILLAKNRELNQWASLKKAIQIRPDHVEKQDQRLYKMKAKNEDLKRKIFKSLYGEGSDTDTDDEKAPTDQQLCDNQAQKDPMECESKAADAPKESKKSRQRRKRRAQAALLNGVSTNADSEVGEKITDNGSVTSAKKSKLDEGTHGPSTTVTTENMAKKKRKRNRKKASKSETTPTSNGQSSPNQPNPFKPESQKVKELNNNNSFLVKKQSATEPIGTSNPFKAKHTGPVNGTGNNKFRTKFTPGFKPFSRKAHNQNGKKDGSGTGTGESNITDDRLKAYGINPRKFHKKQKYGNNQN